VPDRTIIPNGTTNDLPFSRYRRHRGHRVGSAASRGSLRHETLVVEVDGRKAGGPW
jgi:hypothetical protein